MKILIKTSLVAAAVALAGCGSSQSFGLTSDETTIRRSFAPLSRESRRRGRGR